VSAFHLIDFFSSSRRAFRLLHFYCFYDDCFTDVYYGLVACDVTLCDFICKTVSK